MDKIHMADIVPLLPIPDIPKGRSSFYTPCPKCDNGIRKKDKHLNISFSKDVFRCARCGWNGGIFDLYAYYTNTPRDKVRNALKRVFDSNDCSKSRENGKASNALQEPAPLPTADIDIRHTVYSALLSMLTLAPDHMRNLSSRGLSEQEISKNGYRTTPVVGVKAMARQLSGMGLNLKGVPGFYTDSDGQWAFINMQRGILIPVRDSQGRIQGLQVRRDNTDKRKYRWVSSAGIDCSTNGCGAEGWTHIAGPARENIILIEGPLKADVVHFLTGQTVVAVPGVNSLKHLEQTLLGLRELGLTRIMTAFDMDFLKNPHVMGGYEELVSLLGRVNVKFGTYLWHPDYNGLDDYVWKYCLGCCPAQK
jgi:hypothetical protein